MTVTQYIGARYVPLFSKPLEWDMSKEYEPLTIVYWKGNSYTSRQAVPSGIDIDNDDYWALTGNYNAQIEQYRQEVREYDQRIKDNADAIAQEAQTRKTEDDAIDARLDSAESTLETLGTAAKKNWTNQITSKNGDVITSGAVYSELDENTSTFFKGGAYKDVDSTPKAGSQNLVTSEGVDNAIDSKIANSSLNPENDIFVAFGDSYGTSMCDGPFWHAVAAKKLGIKPDNVKVYCKNSAKWNDDTNNYIRQQVDTASSQLTIEQKNNTKYVGIVAITNDGGVDVTSSMQQTLAYICSVFPNAVVGVGLNGGINMLRSNNGRTNRQNALNLNGTINDRVFIDSFIYLSMHPQALKSDNLHLTTYGSNLYGTQMATLLQGNIGASIISINSITPELLYSEGTYGLNVRIINRNAFIQVNTNVLTSRVELTNSYPFWVMPGSIIHNGGQFTGYISTSSDGHLRLDVASQLDRSSGYGNNTAAII